MRDTFDFNALRNLPDGKIIEFLNSLYAAGYSSGHHHTVESSYQEVYPEDKATYFHDDVCDFTIHYFPRQIVKSETLNLVEG